MSTTALHEAPTGKDEIDLTPNPDTGQLLNVPRVKIVIDESDPTVLKYAVSGGDELDRTDADQVAFFNGLKPGTEVEIRGSVFVTGAKKTHRRDSDGHVDAIVETKTLVITDIYVLTPEEL